MAYKLLDDEPSNKYVDAASGIARNVARTGTNLATRAVGLPGDILSLVNEFVAKPISEKITGHEGVPYEKTLLGKVLPTTESHREALATKTGDYLKPRNKIEKFSDDVLEDAALLFNPSKAVKLGGALLGKGVKNLAKSLGANLAGESVKQLTGNELAGNLTKIGTLGIASIIDHPGAEKQISDLYKKQDDLLSPNAKVNSRALSKNLDHLETKITKKRPIESLSSEEKYVLNQINKIRPLIESGEASVEQLIAQKRSFNADNANLFKEFGSARAVKGIKEMAKPIGTYLKSAIKEHKSANPEWYKYYNAAEEGFATIAKSNYISRWVENNLGYNPVTLGLAKLFMPTAAGFAAPIYYPAKYIYRISKSPTLRKIYGNTLKSAVKEDATSFNKYLKELDQEIQKEEVKTRYRFID